MTSDFPEASLASVTFMAPARMTVRRSVIVMANHGLWSQLNKAARTNTSLEDEPRRRNLVEAQASCGLWQRLAASFMLAMW